MKVDSIYADRVQKCIQCSFGSARNAACTEDKQQFHDHALSGDCPKGYYSVSGRMPPPAIIDPGYKPTPANATRGRCCS
jgi:hypothetical protein